MTIVTIALSAVAALLMPIGVLLAQASARNVPLIELRLARETPAPGFRPNEAAFDSVFYVDEESLLSDTDIAQARAVRSATGLMIFLTVSQEAAIRIGQVTKEHVGERIAILLEGELVEVPLIVEPLVTHLERRIDLGVTLSDAAAERIAVTMAARWPHSNH